VPAAGQAREATVTQQAVTVLVPEHPAPASEKSAEPRVGRMRRWSPASGDGALPAYQRARRVPVNIGSRPSPASPPSPAAPPARACDANPLAGFGSEASEDQHYVLDASHTPRKG
jgi:hypothetical protein